MVAITFAYSPIHILPILIISLLWPRVYSNQLAFVSNANYSSDIIAFQSGDVVLGGLFSVHFHYNPLSRKCGYISERGVKWVQAMIYTIDQINNNQNILPNITIGFDIRDTCSSASHALEESLDFVIYSHLEDKRRRNALLGNICGKDFTPSSNTYYQSPEVRNQTVASSFSAIPNIAAVIGGRSSRVSIAVASLLSNFDIAQISYASTSRLLSDTIQYKSFFRTVPTDENQAKAIVDIVKHFNWTYVSTVAVDDSYGRLAVSSFQKKAAAHGICIAVDQRFPSQNNKQAIREIVAALKAANSAKVIILFCAEYEAIDFLEEASNQNLTDRIFIGSDAWGDSPKVAALRREIVQGMLGVVLNGKHIPKFEDYLKTLNLCNNQRNPWFQQLWYAKSQQNDIAFDPSDCVIPPEFHLNYTDTFYRENSKVVYVMDAIYAVAHALHNMLECTTTYCKAFNNSQIDRTAFIKYIQNVTFNAISVKDFHFSPEGDALGVYEIRNLQPSLTDPNQLQFTTVGEWDMSQTNGMELTLDDKKVTWSTANPNRVPKSRCSEDCLPGTYRKFSSIISCCWECLPCSRKTISNFTNAGNCEVCLPGNMPNANLSDCIDKPPVIIRWGDILSIIVLVLVGVTFIFILLTWAILIKYRHSPIAKASNLLLSHFLLIGISICNLTPIAFIAPPTVFICNLTLFIFSFAISLVMSTIMAKTNRISKIFHSALSFARNPSAFLRNSTQAAFVLILTSIEATICTIATFTDRIEVIRHLSSTDDVYLRCESKTKIGYSIAVGYLAILNIICVYLAFKTRKLPENYNEAKYVSFTSLIMMCIIFTMIPAYFGTSGPFQAAVASFGMITFAIAVLLCMFLPKIYIIIFKPELNTKERAMMDLASFTFSNANNNNYLSAPNSRRPSVKRSSAPATLVGNDLCNNHEMSHSSPYYFGSRALRLSISDQPVINTKQLTPDSASIPTILVEDNLECKTETTSDSST
ncbi:Metabotropic glutamate receptor 2 [Trichoplax sp. H2]|nr:Metabotropic glutamate receptor 2 [Trichoplax sp. H2]|eukprot:RDD46595.1 Metabotropic glutamate receptor 2 [Trichoplax sp. H2]